MLPRDEWSMETRLNHPPEVKLPEGNRPVTGPVYNSAKFALSPDAPYSEQFLYTRLSNPTTRQLELTLAEIQGREDCLVLASGAAALASVFLSTLKQGDHLITFTQLYKPARGFIREKLPHYGIESTFLNLERPELLEEHIRPGKTKLIHFESPSNPNLTLADIEHILAVARKHGVLVSMDGTFGGLHQHTQYPVDFMVHSLTKFGNGHGDVVAGCIAGAASALRPIKELAIYLGATLDPQAAYLVSRGLKTYLLRYERQTQSALKIAQYLKTHLSVHKVYYPGLPEHPGHELAQKQMQQMGGVVTFELKPEVAASAQEFCHRLQLIPVTASLGSTEALICPTLIFFGGDLSPAECSLIGINTHTLRLSVGLEHPDDLISDLSQALR
jgi:cystathionine beta-lyase/cystathionine gamma-synthase